MTASTASLSANHLSLAPGKASSNRNGFFSAIPRAVWDLRAAGRLTPRDVDVLGLLLDYKNRRSSVVEPRQETLAARLRCSVDTIQRSLTRLERAGLLTRARRRDRQGRLGRCIYDLAALLSLMPRQAAGLRSGEWGGADGETPGFAEQKVAKQKDTRAKESEAWVSKNAREREVKPEGEQPENPADAMPQPCGIQEADSEVVQADNIASLPLSPPSSACPVVRSLTSQGLAQPFAASLLTRFGEARCRQVLAAASKVRQVRTSRAGWIVRCLHEKWTLPTEGAMLPASHQPYRFPRGQSDASALSGSSLSDPFTFLTGEERTRLEEIARRALRDEANPLVLAQLNKGRGQSFVRLKMTELARQTQAGEHSVETCSVSDALDARMRVKSVEM